MPAALPISALSAQDQVIQNLFAPPQPSRYNMGGGGGGDNYELQALGASGLLGNAGKFISQLARIQEIRKEENEAKTAAEEIGRIPLLDENYQQRVMEVQSRFPMAFGTQPVQSALRNNMSAQDDIARQQLAQDKYQQDQRKLLGRQSVRKASLEQLAQLEEQAPPELVAELGPDIEKRAMALGEAETLYQQLPPALRPRVDKNNPTAVKSALNKHTSQLPPFFSKIKNNPDEQANAITYAEQIKALRDKETKGAETDKKFSLSEDENATLTAAQEGLEALVGKNPPIDAIIKTKSLLEAPNEQFNPRAADGSIKPEFAKMLQSIAPRP
jgi:hypothetical protein